MKRHYVLPENVFSSEAGMPSYCIFYDASDVDARIAGLEAIAKELLEYFRSGNEIPIDRATIRADSDLVIKARLLMVR
jgi:hypothetical protein